jgi:hypothetical protein
LLIHLFDDQDIPLVGVSIEQQVRSGSSVADGSIFQEPLHIAIETKVDAGVDADQLIRHCEGITPSKRGNYLLLLTRFGVPRVSLDLVYQKAQSLGITFKDLTFESLCDNLADSVQAYETHLKSVVDDYLLYCKDMQLLPDRPSLLRIVPCGRTIDLNAKWGVY